MLVAHDCVCASVHSFVSNWPGCLLHTVLLRMSGSAAAGTLGYGNSQGKVLGSPGFSACFVGCWWFSMFGRFQGLRVSFKNLDKGYSRSAWLQSDRADAWRDEKPVWSSSWRRCIRRGKSTSFECKIETLTLRCSSTVLTGTHHHVCCSEIL